MPKIESLGSSNVSDVLKQLGEKGFIPGLRPVTKKAIIQGSAMPLHIRISSSPRKTLRQGISEACDLSSKGDVLVVCSETTEYSTLGGINALYVKLSGLAGAVIYGAVRDISELDGLKLPVFSLGISPVASTGYVEVDSVGEPVSCGNVNVERGDLVVGDLDGIVIVRQSMKEKIPKLVAELGKKEKQTILDLRRKLVGARGRNKG